MQKNICVKFWKRTMGLGGPQIAWLRWANVGLRWSVRLDANVGPTSLCSSGERSANMLGQRWPNVASFFLQRFASVTPTYMVYYSQRKKITLGQVWPPQTII